jgi:hypothetical protein
MKSYELLRDVFHQCPAKTIAATLKLSLSTVHRWARPCGAAGTGMVNPLDRVTALMACVEDDRLIEWLCEQRGGVFVRNPQPKALPPQLLVAASQTEHELAELLGAITQASVHNQITRGEAAVIRSRWQRLKSVGESFVQRCEAGVFLRLPPVTLLLGTMALRWLTEGGLVAEGV